MTSAPQFAKLARLMALARRAAETRLGAARAVARGRERAAKALEAQAQAEAHRLAERRAEGQTVPARGRVQSFSSPSGRSADSGTGSPGIA